MGRRKSLKDQHVLVAFRENEEGHWDEISLARKIRVSEGRRRRTLAFVGRDDRGPRVVLWLRSPCWILTTWPEECSGRVATITEEQRGDRESLAKEARDASGISEFKVSGSLRGAWHEAQRKDESLAGHFRKVSHPYRVAGDGVLEREVQLKTGQTIWVVVVPNGVVADNGVTWRKSCYFAVHGGVLGAHRSAEVTFKLLERSVWWPSMKEDINRWVESCLSCLKGRGRPTKVEAKAVKCVAATCWEEVSVDCEGPNKEDREGYRYSLTYFCCLSHAVMLEPLRSLTHSDVRKAFTRCVLRSRTIPSLVRSDRGVEFKNALMKELNAILGVQQRFSTALRPCEMGSNERMHQEVQKTLGALVRELGVAENWSDWLIVAEYILDNTPGPHGYAPRDLERSWSLALPLEKDVLHEALQFEPISDWARRQFSQFQEIAQVVTKHWNRASEARAKLANRFRRHVDLKVGDRVVWKSPTARPEGAARVPWKPGMHGPWEVVDIRGNRLWLEAVEPPLAGGPRVVRRRHEAHAEDCILVPADSHAESRAPVVFDDPGDEGPSLGQQASGEARQVEFTLPHRGRDFILRIGDKIAYRKVHVHKVAHLGKVTQVDVAQAQVSVHRYVPDATGLRVKWKLEYLDEEGRCRQEGTRPLHELVTIKEVICKVDLMKDGALAAGSARKLDKGGYSLKESGVRVHLVRNGPGSCLHLVEEVLGLLSAESVPSWPSVWQSAEGRIVWSWLEKHPPSRIDFWEIFAGQAGLTFAAKQRGLSVAPPLDRIYPAFGKIWDLTLPVDQELFWCLYAVLLPAALHAGLPCEHYSVMGQRKPDSNDRTLRELVIRVLSEQERAGRKGTAENPTASQLWSEDDWARNFGQLASPKHPWQYASTDACQYGMESKSLTDGSFGQPVKKGQIWLGNFCLSEFSLRCGRPDALGQVEHSHRHIKGSAKVEVSGGTKWMGCGILSGIYEPACCHAYMSSLKRALRTLPVHPVCQKVPPLEGSASRNSVYVAAPEHQGVVTSEELSPAEKEELDKEVTALSKKMDELWKARADQKEWDSVRADLSVYQYSGQKVTEDPRRVESYRQQVVKELGFGDDWKERKPYLSEADVAACREVVERKAGGFWLEGSPRTTVRNVLHDCVPSGPPVSSQPHNLKGEAASWVDEKLEEEVRRGQLVRGTSAWGSPPFPTREAPAHKRHRKRRLVVDYRRVNSRVVRSTYYCRKATDVLATAAGSIWYSFVDAVTGFNQIKNTRRAMEVLAIVARSGKFLPVCLTFGPVNGPDDFCYVVDRAYAPGRGRKMKYTREWVAYVDDLTVRTGRVVDGKFLTDDQAEDEVREACKNAPMEAVQRAGDALEALGVKGLAPDPVSGSPGVGRKHDETTSDHNHPTRRFFGSRKCTVLFCLLGECWFISSMPPQPFRSFEDPRGSWEGRGVAAVGSRTRLAADFRPAGQMGKKSWTNPGQKYYWEDPEAMGRAMTKAYRHGGYKHRGHLDLEGWIRLEASRALFQVPLAHMKKAVELDGKGAKKRFEVKDGWIRAVQGHSSDSGISDPGQVYHEVTDQSLAERGLDGNVSLWHGTVLERCDGIVRFGMLPGGGDASNRLTVYWVAGTKPSPEKGKTGFRADSTAVVETSVRRLWEHGVKLYHGADGEHGVSSVLLSLEAPPESLIRILSIGDKPRVFSQVLGEITESGFQLVHTGKKPEGSTEPIELPDGDTDATTDEEEVRARRDPASSSGTAVKEEPPAEAAGSGSGAPGVAESAREEPMEEPPADAEVAVEEVAGRKAAPPETQKEEPEAGGVPQSADASLGAELKDRTLETEPGAAPSAAGEREGKEQTLEPTKDDGEEFVEVEEEGEASPDLEAKAARRKRSKKEGHSEKGHSGRRRHRRPSKRLKILKDANLKEKRYRSHSEEEATGGDREQRGDAGRSRSRSRGVSSRSPPRRPRSPDLPPRRPKSPDGPPPEPSSRERFSLRPVRFEWGSWVCHVCGAVNAPGDEYCFVCDDSFWNSTEWANELYREIRRRERAAKKAEFSTLLAKALAAGRWECDRCGGENMLSRVKCYQCSTLRSRHRGDDESSDSERDRRVQQTLNQMPEAKQRKKRGGRKHNKKKVCRCGSVHHQPHRGHRLPRRVKGLSTVQVVEISLRKGLVNRRWKKHSLPRKLLNKLQHALNGNGLTFDLAVKVLVAASLAPLAWRTEQEAEEVLGSRVIFEIEETTAQTIQVTGLIFKSAVLSLGIIVLWFLGRAVTNRLVRAYHGNSLPTKLLEYKADGQTTWEVSGSKGKHVVWIRLTTPRQSACACRGFIDSGTCGHIDAAVDQARTMGLVPARAVRFEEASTAKDRGAAALRGMGVSGQSTEALCFTGMVDKAQRLFRPEKPNALTESGDGSGCFKGLTHGKVKEEGQLAVGEKDAVVREPAARGKGAAPTGGIEVEYLKDRASQTAVMELLNRYPNALVYLTAYSLDQPELVRSLGQHKGRIQILADAGQTHESRTKMQLQSLMEIRSQGHQVKMARGGNLAKTYQEDGRSVKIGSGLKGIQHAKSCLVLAPPQAYMVIGSSNWTTSSKSNREAGVLLTLPQDHQCVRDFQDHFFESWNGAALLEEEQFQQAKTQGGRGRAQ